MSFNIVVYDVNINILLMYVQRNIEARSRNHCCSGKSVRITDSECVFVALGNEHALRVRHIICDLPGSTIFFPHYLINVTIFGRKGGHS